MDDRAEFIRKVEAHLPPKLRPYVSDIPEVAAMLKEIGFINYKYPQQDISKVIQFLPRWSAHQESKDKGGIIEGGLNAHALLTADYLAESLKPRIRAIRKTHFGDVEPPFDSLQEAEDWANVYDSGTIFLEEEKAKKWASVFGVKGPLDNWEWVADDSIGEKLYDMTRSFWKWDEVENEIFDLSDKTGISPETLRLYVLADIKPLQTPYEISMPGQEYCKGKRKCWYVDIRVNTELSFENLIEVYNTVKEALGVKKGKRLNQRHLGLYTMVLERGGAPRGKGTVEFWQALLEEWNDRHEGMYQEWRCIKRAYDRLYKKLNAQYQIKEAHHERLNKAKR